jgi:hypothetical protein
LSTDSIGYWGTAESRTPVDAGFCMAEH